jgi:hypothetical protein
MVEVIQLHVREYEHDRSPGAIGASGAIGGALGGLLMGLFAMLHAAAAGLGVAHPLRLIAAVAYGGDALVSGSAPLAGLTIHLAISIVLGMLFAFVARSATDLRTSMFLGAVFGAAVWLVMTLAILPIVDPVLRDHARTMPVLWFVGHLIFGLSVGVSPLFRRTSARKLVRKPSASSTTSRSTERRAPASS